MSYPKVSALIPNFQRPEDFERAANGRWFCRPCPTTEGGPHRTFRNDACALAHERTPLHHRYVTSAAEVKEWSPNANDWNYKASEWELTPEEAKEQEHRQRVQETPDRVGAWVKSWATFQNKGQMASVHAAITRPADAVIGHESDFDEPSIDDMDDAATNSSKTSGPKLPQRKHARNRPTFKSITYSDAVNVTESPALKGPRRQAPIRSPVVNVPTWSSSPAVDISKTQPTPNTALDTKVSRKVPVPRPVTPPPPICVSPEMKKWMRTIATVRRLSPTKEREMHEFLQLPTDRKVSKVQSSIYQVHALFMS